MCIEIDFKERCILKLLGELVFNCNSLNFIVVKVKYFLMVMKDDVEDEVEDDEEFL